MKPIQRFFWLFLAGLASLWLATNNTQWTALSGVFAWRNELTQLSGVIGIGVMSVAMVLAVRPVWFESALGGLDKMYRLHKWLGIGALVLAAAHWLLANAPKWAVGWGWLARPERGARPVIPVDEIVRQFFSSQRGLAESLGEWAFYAAVLLLVLALIKRFPYRHFLKVHHLLALVYLVLAFHSAILLKFDAWGSPLGVVLALLLLAGSVSSVLVLLGQPAKRRQMGGVVTRVAHQPALQVLQVEVAVHGAWPGHAAGQFAYLTLHKDEGAHPYSIASSWRGDGRLTFLIKALGDYTATLADSVQVNDAVTVEGPYGRFDFNSTHRRQIWVSGGIGITPFVARMKSLAQSPQAMPVDLFHSTTVLDTDIIDTMTRDAAAARVKLHVLHSAQQGRLDAAHIAAQVPDWQAADVWFCGPAQLGQALKAGLAAMGLPATRFHQELFEMR